MNRNIVAISVEKIQKYIYKYIDQNQKDNKTLRNIILASYNISKDISNKIRDRFDVNKDLILLWISGKVIFKSDLPKEEINSGLIELYREVYIEYRGNIFLNYCVFSENDLLNMEIIRKANINLKSNHNKVKIIEENQDLLFNFKEFKATKSENETKSRLSERKEPVYYSKVFLNSMDDLIDTESKDTDGTDGKIAIVKADINNLGKIMEKVDNFDKFKKTSEILKKYIDLEYFASCICENQEDTVSANILPFYIAGDDIFYAVKIGCLFDSIRILKKIIDKINIEIEDIFNKKENSRIGEESYGVISIAVGVTFVNNHQPIRYYRQIVEDELNAAKNMMKSDEKNLSIMGLSISGCKFNWYKKISETDSKKGKSNKSNGKSDGLNRFCAEIKELSCMMSDNVFTVTSLHNLLINLENEKEPEKQLLYILYYCKPNLVENEILNNNEKFNNEFYFKNYIISQIVEDSKGKREKFFDKNKIQNILIPKLKIIILYLKENNYCKQVDIRENYAKSNKKNYIKYNKNARSNLLNKPMNYLLKEAGKDGIEKLFIKIDNIKRKRLYKSANFKPSVFFRVKELVENNKRDQVIKLFENYLENVIGEKDKENSKNINRLDFNIVEFKRKFYKTENTLWLDRLILLFEYDEQRIIYKTYKKKNKNSNNAGKKRDKNNCRRK